MKLFRTVEIETDDCYRVDDVITFTLNGGEKVEAIAVKKERDGMVFILMDCLRKEYPMHHTLINCDGYDSCDLRKRLNTEIIKRFPTEITEKMVAFENGDMLRIPSESEIFGCNYNLHDKPDNAAQWTPMKSRRNRVAYQGSRTGVMTWYWLLNKTNDSFLSFATVNINGFANHSGACCIHGVRLVFKLKSN